MLGHGQAGASAGDVRLPADPAGAYAALVARGRVICREDPCAPIAVRVTGRGADGITDGLYDRRGGLRCAAWEFAQGDPWTVVALNTARFHTIPCHAIP
jgi:hypothetical protein